MENNEKKTCECDKSTCCKPSTKRGCGCGDACQCGPACVCGSSRR